MACSKPAATTRDPRLIAAGAVLAGAAIGLLLLSWPLMTLMAPGEVPLVILGQFGFALLIGSYGAVNPIAIGEIFPRNVRSSAVSTAYDITVGVFSGTARRWPPG